MPRERSDPDLSGRVVGGRYLLMRAIGRGGMGTVYRANDLVDPREVAIKVLSHERAHTRNYSNRFQREIEALQRIEHPNTVRVYDFGTTEQGDLWFAMELVRGQTLAREIDAGVSTDRIGRIIRQVLLALDAVHSAGIVHRDLKPSNIMVEDAADGPRVKVLDFGVVRFTDPDRSVLTARNTLLGTPSYIAPELVLGKPIDARSDLYAVGICLHALATGSPPFTGADSSKILRAQVSESPPSVPAGRLSSSLDDLRVSLLRKEPGARPQDARQALAILDGRAPIPPASNRRWVWMLGLGLACALGFAVGFAILAGLGLWLSS